MQNNKALCKLAGYSQYIARTWVDKFNSPQAFCIMKSALYMSLLEHGSIDLYVEIYGRVK